MADHRGNCVMAKVLIAGQALLAAHAAFGIPSDADAVAGLGFFCMFTHGDDAANDFVTWHKRIFRVSPVVFPDGKIGVTDTAEFNGDFDFVGAQGAWIIINLLKWLTRSGSGPGADSCHDCFSGFLNFVNPDFRLLSEGFGLLLGTISSITTKVPILSPLLMELGLCSFSRGEAQWNDHIGSWLRLPFKQTLCLIKSQVRFVMPLNRDLGRGFE
jgi:hypothetical protein